MSDAAHSKIAAVVDTLFVAGTAISGPAPMSIACVARAPSGESIVFVSATSVRGRKHVDRLEQVARTSALRNGHDDAAAIGVVVEARFGSRECVRVDAAPA